VTEQILWKSETLSHGFSDISL